MSERAWKFGDVVKVNPTTASTVPQPDDRRWVVLVVKKGAIPWAFAFLGLDSTNPISHWKNTYGFCLADEELDGLMR